MKRRIEKKLSKRIAQILPDHYSHSWKCEYTQMICVGGEVNYWGEGQDEYSVYEEFRMNYPWFALWGFYPEGHRFEHYPVHDKKRATGKRLIEVANIIKQRELAA